MPLPQPTRLLLERDLRSLDTEAETVLSPHRRLEYYASLGPTFAPATYIERLDRLRQAAVVPLTRADCIRAYLALLSAQRVLPLWVPTLTLPSP